MRKKIKGNSGLTVVEMLAAVAVLTLLLMMLGTGMQMAMNSYRKVIAQSEVDLLLSTAVDALADELRYARDVVVGNDNKLKSYTSDSYGKETYLYLDSSGRIMAKGTVEDGQKEWRVLSTGAYGSGAIVTYTKYEVKDMKIEYKDNIFSIYLKVGTADSRNISADTSVTVRCLNPYKTTT